MRVRPLAVRDAYEFTPTVHTDERGEFAEWFTEVSFVDAVGHAFPLRQANVSMSRKGALRGLHYADVPPGQAKFISCIAGAVMDVVVDIRVDSPTFGAWDSVRLDDRDRRSVYLAEGLAHAFLALTDGATVTYFCSEGYAPQRERAIDALDRAISIAWPADVPPLLSPRDAQAPSLAEAREAGHLPRYVDCVAHYATLASPG